MAEIIKIEKSWVSYLTQSEDSFMNLLDPDNTTTWFGGWSVSEPAKVLVTLPYEYKIEKLSFQNYTGSRTFNVYGGMTPFNTTLISSTNFTQYNQKVDVVTDKNVKFLIFEIPQVKVTSPGTLVIYGTKVSDVTTTYVNKFPATVDGLFGINGFHWVPTDKLEGFNLHRMYQDWKWFESSKGKYTFSPTHVGDGDYDVYYAALKDKGITPIATVHNSPDWSGLNNEYLPALDGATTDPKSYVQFAKMLFQMVARYGSMVVPTRLLSVNSTPRWSNDKVNTVKTGLGLLKYIEIWNEPEKWWRGISPANAKPQETAAMISACVDGHCNTMGEGVGIKNADANMKIVMPGLTSFNVQYVVDMVNWWTLNRADKKIPVDIFNFHHYANSNNNGNGASSDNSIGVSPEDNDLKGKIIKVKELLSYLDPSKEVAVTEFGYVTSTNSSQRCPAIGSMSQNVVQGVWIARTILEMAAAGLDKACMYEIYDQSPSEYELWGKAGAYTADYKEKKPVAFYLESMKRLLAGAKFAGDISDATFKRYKFTAGSKEIHAIWLPTSRDAKATYDLDLKTYSKATRVTLAEAALENSAPLTVGGVVKLDVSEKPIFFILEKDGVVVVPPVVDPLGTSYAVPGKIYANKFSAQYGARNISGSIMGQFDANNYITYYVNVQKTGTYELALNIGVAFEGPIEIRDFSGKVLSSFRIYPTGGYDKFAIVKTNVNLVQGLQMITVYCGGGSFGMESISFTEVGTTPIPPVIPSVTFSASITGPAEMVIPTGSKVKIGTVEHIGPKTIKLN